MGDYRSGDVLGRGADLDLETLRPGGLPPALAWRASGRVLRAVSRSDSLNQDDGRSDPTASGLAAMFTDWDPDSTCLGVGLARLAVNWIEVLVITRWC